MGGDSAKEQIRALQEGVDIVCGTPGRLDDLVGTERLDLSGVSISTNAPCFNDFINRCSFSLDSILHS